MSSRRFASWTIFIKKFYVLKQDLLLDSYHQSREYNVFVPISSKMFTTFQISRFK